jgi:hypothetical protein
MPSFGRRVRLGPSAAFYCRVSTRELVPGSAPIALKPPTKPVSARNETLRAFAKKAGYKSPGSGRKSPQEQGWTASNARRSCIRCVRMWPRLFQNPAVRLWVCGELGFQSHLSFQGRMIR